MSVFSVYRKVGSHKLMFFDKIVIFNSCRRSYMSIFHKNRAAKEKGIKEKTGLHARSRRKYMNECALALQLVQLP